MIFNNAQSSLLRANSFIKVVENRFGINEIFRLLVMSALDFKPVCIPILVCFITCMSCWPLSSYYGRPITLIHLLFQSVLKIELLPQRVADLMHLICVQPY